MIWGHCVIKCSGDLATACRFFHQGWVPMKNLHHLHHPLLGPLARFPNQHRDPMQMPKPILLFPLIPTNQFFFFWKFHIQSTHLQKNQDRQVVQCYTLILQISSPPPSGDPGIASRSPECFPSCPETKWSHVLNAICIDKVNDLSKHPYRISLLFRLSNHQHW